VAPEVISKKGYDGAKADIWSCGVILFVLLAGYLPFQDSNLLEMYSKITRGEFRCPQWFPAEARKLLSRIIDPNPSTRIDVAKLKENAWFKKGFKKIEAPPPPLDFENISIGDVQAAFELACSEDDLKRDVNAATSPMKPTCLNAFDIISLSPFVRLVREGN